MENYIEIIKIAVITFPFIAFLISIPFILSQYHKFGSISRFKTFIIYSFVLYCICAYFLVILPLPKISEVALLKTPRVQLIPFSFIIDFFKNSPFNLFKINTYLSTIKSSYFYVPIYNIFLTLPFGIYLRYYFKCSLKKTFLLSFLLSLFFELTQLSGLYFIYPRGYRLFDVDDLLLNTLGGVIGYFIITPILKILPTRESIDIKATEQGKNITGFKRSTVLLLDLFMFLIIELALEIILSGRIKSTYLIIFTILIYYFIIPIFLKCKTLGLKFLNLEIEDYKNTPNIYRLFLRNLIFIFIYFVIPYLCILIISNISSDILKEFIGLIFMVCIFIYDLVTALKYFFTNKQMLYEKISKTKLVSTIK